MSPPTAGLLAYFMLAGIMHSEWQSPADRVTLKGSLVCNGACIVDPKQKDHGMVLFAIDGTREVRAEVDNIMKEFYPERGLDGEAAQKLMDQFSARLKYHLASDSPALRDSKNAGKNHYC